MKTEEILRYHEEAKHHYNRYAKYLGYMDWNNQPNPFRFYEKVKSFPLPLLKNNSRAGYMDLYTRENNIPKTFSLENISRFMELALGLSAWTAESRAGAVFRIRGAWAKRDRNRVFFRRRRTRPVGFR